MSNVLSLHHIVFATKYREMTIPDGLCSDLYRMCISLINQKKCKVIRINGTPNHIHILIDLNPTISLSELVKHLKQKTSIWMKESGLFPMFTGWAKEYFAHSVSNKDLKAVKEYIINQKIHHLAFPYDSELKKLTEHVGLTYYEHKE